MRITRLGVRNYDNLFEEDATPVAILIIGWVEELSKDQEPESDVAAVQEGYISITPIHLDLTDYRLIETYRIRLANTYPDGEVIMIIVSLIINTLIIFWF